MLPCGYVTPSPLDIAIFRTLAYFSFSQFPLSAFEVWKWLLLPERDYTFADVHTALETSIWLKQHMQQTKGYYALGDVHAWAQEREYRYLDAQRKERRLRFWIKLLTRLPHVQAVGICNSLAWHFTNKKSDCDLFIITDAKKVWSVRLLSLLPLRLFRLRPGEKEEDPICLSFFVDTTAMDMSQFRLEEYDWYLAYWCASVSFLFARPGIEEQWRAQNAWVYKLLPHAWFTQRTPAYRLSFTRKIPFLRFPEQLARQIQEARLPAKLIHLRNVDTRVVINEHVLKFHENDRRRGMMEYVRNLMIKAGI